MQRLAHWLQAPQTKFDRFAEIVSVVLSTSASTALYFDKNLAIGLVKVH